MFPAPRSTNSSNRTLRGGAAITGVYAGKVVRDLVLVLVAVAVFLARVLVIAQTHFGIGKTLWLGYFVLWAAPTSQHHTQRTRDIWVALLLLVEAVCIVLEAGQWIEDYGRGLVFLLDPAVVLLLLAIFRASWMASTISRMTR